MTKVVQRFNHDARCWKTIQGERVIDIILAAEAEGKMGPSHDGEGNLTRGHLGSLYRIVER